MDGISRILRRFVGATIIICIFLLVLDYTILASFVFKGMNGGHSPKKELKNIARDFNNNSSYELSEDTKKVLTEKRLWAILIDDSGDVIWNYRLPSDIPNSFTLTDIAKLSRNFLEDYPVFVWEHEYGLIVLGYPKKSFAKYQFQMPVSWISSLPMKVGIMFIINIVIALMLSVFVGTRLIKSVKPLIKGIHNLANEKPIFIKTKGVLMDIANSINQTSNILQEKNTKLKERDMARSNWIAGISHDIRTPLSMVLGYASELEHSTSIPMECKQQAGIIRQQGEKLRSLVNDLNLVSMLEYDMQPLNLTHVRLSKVARQVVVDFLNNGLDEKFVITLDVSDENILVIADEKLLIRAVYNLVLNSIVHNPDGCEILISTSVINNELCCFSVSDNGKGISEDKIENLTRLPYTSNDKNSNVNGHGLGLPMVARIAKAHKGQLILTSDNKKGLKAMVELPQYNNSDGRNN
ncbi:two-component sensor histidine kinase [Vallitalea longa]|uniref:histidine kinase n=1 Tax=Vallitalea longa TaxID=2936439 RepID=A0A9W5Y879_9FIRM|nr:HAMP domain-containing sensor histidine kinase [Vallitalea longa]GKX28587.1 two-component sensor histidine kinase [Vallitalea longa]